MNELFIAQSRAEADAVDEVVARDEQLMSHADGLLGTLGSATDGAAAVRARDELVRFAHEELLPRLQAQEERWYPAARELDELRRLVDGLVSAHRTLERLVESLNRADRPALAVATAGAVTGVLDVLMQQQHEQLLPVLASSAGHSVAELAATLP